MVYSLSSHGTCFCVQCTVDTYIIVYYIICWINKAYFKRYGKYLNCSTTHSVSLLCSFMHCIWAQCTCICRGICKQTVKTSGKNCDDIRHHQILKWTMMQWLRANGLVSVGYVYEKFYKIFVCINILTNAKFNTCDILNYRQIFSTLLDYSAVSEAARKHWRIFNMHAKKTRKLLSFSMK